MPSPVPQPGDRLTVFDVQGTEPGGGEAICTRFVGVIDGRCYQVAVIGAAAPNTGDVIIITRTQETNSDSPANVAGTGVVGAKPYELVSTEFLPNMYGWVSTSPGEEGLWTPSGNLVKLRYGSECKRNGRWYRIAVLEPGTYVRFGFEGNRLRSFVVRVDQHGPQVSDRGTQPLLPERTTQPAS